MILLTKNFALYDTETFGMETWGSSSQKSLEFKRKNWYIHYWQGGNNWIDDYNEDIKLDVIKTFSDVESCCEFFLSVFNQLKDIDMEQRKWRESELTRVKKWIEEILKSGKEKE